MDTQFIINFITVLIAAITLGQFYGAYSAWRGSGDLKTFGQKPFQIFSIGLICYLLNDIYAAMVSILAIVLYFVDTGTLHQAWKTKKEEIRIEKRFGLNWLAIFLARPKAEATVANTREVAVWYGTLVGLIFAATFAFSQYPILGLPCVLLGVICGAVRHLTPDQQIKAWRWIEYGYFGQFIFFFVLANPQAILRFVAVCGG